MPQNTTTVTRGQVSENYPEPHCNYGTRVMVDVGWMDGDKNQNGF